jgi:hypothetical protein
MNVSSSMLSEITNDNIGISVSNQKLANIHYIGDDYSNNTNNHP